MPLVSERFNLGQRLELALDAPTPEWLPSRLEDHDPTQQRLMVAWPMDRQRRLVPINVGQTLKLAASTPRDALYSASVRVLQTRHDQVPLLEVGIEGEWRRTQRREAVRVSVALLPRRAVRLVGSTQQP